MIKDIERIKEHTKKYIKEYMLNCSIEEKIDTHYITIEIVSKNEIHIRKANGSEIDRVDLILNSMWNNLFFDWNYLKVSNPDWFNLHAGYTIKLFYFPCATPLLTEYDPNVRYVFDRLIFNGKDLDAEYILSDIKFPDAYKVDYKCKLTKVEDPIIIYNEHIDKVITGEESCATMFKLLVDNEKSKKYAVNNPEGYIFKHNKTIYQISETIKQRTITNEKSSYEFLLSNFIKFCKEHEYSDKINVSYTSSVCNLFNDFIVNGEKLNHYIENNIDIESIESPYLGHKFDISYDLIPDPVTKNLCKESELYKNIFKVLLANLRKGKDFSRCIYMSKKEVNDWNNIMKSLKIRNSYI